MKKQTSAVYAGLIAGMLCCAGALSASAYTADDVAAKARSAGWPETLIQMGYNQWASGQYTQDDLDTAYNSVTAYSEDQQDFICNAMGIDPNEFKKKVAEKESAQKETQPETSGDSEIQPAETETQNSYIPENEFINMTLEQKQEYISSLPEEQKSDFLSGLSSSAKNNIIKQLPTEQKMALMQDYIDTANTMGMNVTVDEITDKELSVTVRNQEGIVVDNASVGISVDETGISHTKPLCFASIGILTALAGFGVLYWYSNRKDSHYE